MKRSCIFCDQEFEIEERAIARGETLFECRSQHTNLVVVEMTPALDALAAKPALFAHKTECVGGLCDDCDGNGTCKQCLAGDTMSSCLCLNSGGLCMSCNGSGDCDCLGT